MMAIGTLSHVLFRTRHPVHFAKHIEPKKVVSLNGDQLPDFMIDHRFGVTTTETYDIKEVSNDLFDESER